MGAAAILIPLLLQYGPEVINDLIAWAKSSDAPSPELINQLYTLLKPAEAWFTVAPPAKPGGTT